jgi:hypothetical protein
VLLVTNRGLERCASVCGWARLDYDTCAAHRS